jgi:beta-aspartyl-peptidase (threonine type)
VHGGAGGWSRGAQFIARARAACEEAAASGLQLLARGGSALDAVEVAVRRLEDEPILNAGRGSYPNTDGIVELDALIMDGANLAAGAVAAVQRVLHPVSLARRVMTETPHVLLVGEGASAYADRIGFPRCSNEDLLAPGVQPAAGTRDTVGAVALDDHGSLAAATSTGGIPNKLPGRVGDSPIPGAGAYADNAAGAVSATGDGEAFIRLVVSKRMTDDMALGATAQAACDAAMRLIGQRLHASGGVIAIDRTGRPGVSFNTRAMPWALASSDGGLLSGSDPGDPLL